MWKFNTVRYKLSKVREKSLMRNCNYLKTNILWLSLGWINDRMFILLSELSLLLCLIWTQHLLTDSALCWQRDLALSVGICSIIGMYSRRRRATGIGLFWVTRTIMPALRQGDFKCQPEVFGSPIQQIYGMYVLSIFVRDYHLFTSCTDISVLPGLFFSHQWPDSNGAKHRIHSSLTGTNKLQRETHKALQKNTQEKTAFTFQHPQH